MSEPGDEVQTRSEETGLEYWPTLEAAFDHAEADPTVWKVSYSLPDGERVRLVRFENGHGPTLWRYEPLMEAVAEEILDRLRALDDE